MENFVKEKNSKLVLGIDPGYDICGYGFLQSLQGNRMQAVHYGAVITNKKMLMQDRVKKIYDELNERIQHFQPEAIGVEKLFFNQNITTAIPVAQVRGVILLLAAQHHLPLIELTPLQIKQAVTGYGRAKKEQVIFMVTRLLHLQEAPKPDDVADALAVAICAANCLESIQWRNDISS